MTRHLRPILLAAITAAAMMCAVAAHGQEMFERKLEQVSFVPKGAWVTGVSVSYSQTDVDKYKFLIIENIGGDTYSFKVSPTLMFCFKDNLTAGGRFSYTRQRTHLNSADLVIAEGTEFNIKDLYCISHNYYGTALFRQYLSLGRSTRFGLFNEIQVQVGGGQSKLCSGTGDDIIGTYERNLDINVGLAPGLAVFLTNYSAIEVNVGVLGFSFNHTSSATNQIYQAHRQTKAGNFKVNLFSITFGVMFYI